MLGPDAENVEIDMDDIARVFGALGSSTLRAEEEGRKTAEEKARELVIKALDYPPSTGRKYAHQALELDPGCMEAYEYLGGNERDNMRALVYFLKAIEIGSDKFGGQYLAENKGSFYRIPETRSYMRSMRLYAECLYTLGQVKASIAVMEEMIELNPIDNQGMRDQLLLYLIETNEEEKYLHYDERYKNDYMAFPFYNRCLFMFKKQGDTEESRLHLQKAIAKNKYVPSKLISRIAVSKVPETYVFGRDSEAEHYAYYAREIWQKTPGAVDWLKQQIGRK